MERMGKVRSKNDWVKVGPVFKNSDYQEYTDKEYTDEPYGDRNYTVFGILAGVRDYDVKPISRPRGIPKDADSEIILKYEMARGAGFHNYSYLTLKELLGFDWAAAGQKFFLDEVISQLIPLDKNPENVRIVFWFDS